MHRHAFLQPRPVSRQSAGHLMPSFQEFLQSRLPLLAGRGWRLPGLDSSAEAFKEADSKQPKPQCEAAAPSL